MASNKYEEHILAMIQKGKRLSDIADYLDRLEDYGTFTSAELDRLEAFAKENMLNRSKGEVD